MKTNFTCLILLSLFTLLIGSNCKKKTEEPQLPPETTTGAMTFGCKVNGKVFVPRDGRGKPGLYCQYVFLGNGLGGGWFLNIQAIDQVPANSIGINIVTDSLLLSIGKTYLFKREKGYCNARYYVGLNSYVMQNNDAGQLIITQHNQVQRILSGSFWLDATNANGDKVEIREGRFDIVY